MRELSFINYVSCIELHECCLKSQLEMHDLQELGWGAGVAILLQRAEWKEQKGACLFEMILSELSKDVNRMSPNTKGFQKSFGNIWFSVERYVFGEITNITAPGKHTVPCRPYYHRFYEDSVDLFLSQIFLSGKHISIVIVWTPEEGFWQQWTVRANRRPQTHQQHLYLLHFLYRI